MPSAYDEHLGPVLFAPYAADMAARVAAVRPSAVLELAAGTGRLTAELVAALPSARVEATDLNAAMVDYGRSPGAPARGGAGPTRRRCGSPTTRRTWWPASSG